MKQLEPLSRARLSELHPRTAEALELLAMAMAQELPADSMLVVQPSGHLSGSVRVTAYPDLITVGVPRED